MTTPSNQKERRKAFLNFLILFLACVAIIITTAFYSIQVPFKQNKQLRQQVNTNEKEEDFSEGFKTQLISVSTMLDTINNKSTSPDLLNSNITDNINRMSSMISSDTTYHRALYQYILINLSSLQGAKKQLRDMVGSANSNCQQLSLQNTDLTNKVNLYMSKIQSIQATLNSFRQQVPQPFIDQMTPLLQQ